MMVFILIIYIHESYLIRNTNTTQGFLILGFHNSYMKSHSYPFFLLALLFDLLYPERELLENI